MAQIKDGWHKVHEKDVYVENGKVVRGVTKDANNSEVTCYPYEYSEDHGCWINISGEVLYQLIEQATKKELCA